MKKKKLRSGKARAKANKRKITAKTRKTVERGIKTNSTNAKSALKIGKKTVSRALSEPRMGHISGTGKNYAFFVPDDGSGDLFIAGNCLHGAIDGDVVSVCTVSQKEGAGEGEVVKIFDSPNTDFVGTVRGATVVPDLRGLPRCVDVEFSPFKCGDGEKVVATFTDKGAYPSCVIKERLGLEGVTATEVLSVIRSYRLEEKFSAEVMKEAARLDETRIMKSRSCREDFTDDDVITIDGAHSKDFDDAICVKALPSGGLRLFVHIADVTAFVKEGGELDKTAFRRGTSVYFADRVIPMLPERLSNDLCSLVPDRERLVLTCIMDFDEHGERTSSRVVEGVIKSRARTTYDEIYAFMQGDAQMSEKYSHLAEMLKNAEKLYRILNDRRIKNGSVEFSFIETEFIIDEKGEVVDAVAAKRNDAHKMIEEFMLAANAAVAAMFSKKEVPMVYRVHAAPPAEKVASLIELLKTLGVALDEEPSPGDVAEMLKNAPEKYRDLINMATLRSMSKAEYRPTNDGHYGLNFTDYCHFTSPIRRYPDLAVHRVIKAYLAGERDIKSRYEKWVGDVSVQSSKAEKRAEDAERKVDDVLAAKFMSEKAGQVYKAKITGVTEWGIFASLSCGIEGCVRAEKLPGGNYVFDQKTYSLVCGKQRYRMGDEITIKVDDAFGDRINFSLADCSEE